MSDPRAEALAEAQRTQRDLLDLAVDPTVAYAAADGPAGFGKTYTATSIATHMARENRSVLIAAPTTALVRDTAAELDPSLPAGGLAVIGGARTVAAVQDAIGRKPPKKGLVTVATVAKLAWEDAPDGPRFELGILDEATMQDLAAAVAMFRLCRRVVAMYDSRQQRAFVRTASPLLNHRSRGAVPANVALPRYAERLRPGFAIAPPTRMRTTFRYGQGLADVVSPAYPQPILSAARPHGATVAADATTAAADAVRVALADGAAVATFDPARGTATPSELAARAAADVAEVCANHVRHADGTRVGARNVLVVAARREQVRDVATAVRDRHVPVRITTPADLDSTTITASQGLTVDLVVVVHPLTGLPAADAFHVSLGRILVALTRAKLGAVVVAPTGWDATLTDDVPAHLPDTWHDYDHVAEGHAFHRHLAATLAHVPVG